MAGCLFYVGARLRYGENHEWIAGYNRASVEERREYDIEGLSHHLGNGLMTLGVLLLLATLASCLSWWTFVGVTIGAFILVAIVIPIGGQRFTPRGRRPKTADDRHAFLKWLLPDRAYRAVERGTRQWWIECPRGHLVDFWEAGGVRYKAVGEPRQWAYCERCHSSSFHRVRRKQPSDPEPGPNGWA